MRGPQSSVEDLYRETRDVAPVELALHPAAVEPEGTTTWLARAQSLPARCDRFFRRCLQVYEAVLRNELPPIVAQMLFGADEFGLTYHRGLGDAALRVPQSFRTDEGADGRILEIQSPGSAWGELLILLDYFDQPDTGRSDAAVLRYVRALREFTGTDDPALLYLTDASSAQPGTRSFVARTRALGVRYYGWDPSVSVGAIDHIRAHSFMSLIAENLHNEHRIAAISNERLYDLPLNALFDSKVLLPLPFWRHTSEFFDDDDRSLFAYSAFLEPNEVQLESGEVASRTAFLARPPRDRRYYLKYAGSDLSRNWGSRAVYRMRTRGSSWRATLDSAWAESGNGSAWILQSDVDYPQAGNKSAQEGGHSKYSNFCAYGQHIGSLAMYRDHFKVHAQESTTMAPVRGSA